MLLFVTRKYPPAVGGMERTSHRLVAEVGRCQEVKVISWGRSQAWLPLFLVSALFRAAWALWRQDITVIHLGDALLAPLGCALGFLGHVPVVATVHGLDVVYPNRLYQFLIPRYLRRLDWIVCVSHYTRSECLKRGVSADRCTVVPWGIEVGEYVTAVSLEARQRLAEEWRLCLDGTQVLLTVGRLVPRKGIAPFVSQALKLLQTRRDDWVYVIVGEGPERAAIEAAIESHGLEDRVRLVGRVSEETLKAAYALANVFVMPNVPVAGDAEGFGVVSLEARAAGLPVVAARLEGISESMNEEDGILVGAWDYVGYVEAIDHLLTSESVARKRQQRRDRVAERYDWGRTAAGYMDLFYRVRCAYDRRQGGVDENRD